MRFSTSKLDPDELADDFTDALDERQFERIRKKSAKPRGKRALHELSTAQVDPSDPFARFDHPDLNTLGRMGYLDELHGGIKTGKEASVYLGKNANGWVAVKVYTELRVRAFRRDAAYRTGRYIGDARVEKAIRQGSSFGLDSQQGLWVQEEFEQMQYLQKAGVCVPNTVAFHGLALIMEFIGAADGQPAARLSDLHLDPADAQSAFRQAVQNLQRIVAAGRVHGDYSTFNLLWHRGQVVVIDFPQVMERKQNPNAADFLRRDIRSLCQSFLRLGVQADEARISRELRAY